jgi:hypothetical protein
MRFNVIEFYRYLSRDKTFKQKVFIILFIIPLTLFIGAFVKGLLNRLEEKRRYKKVIKKGFFWNTEYLIEKDNYQ